MITSDFNALLMHIKSELKGFKRHYKLYDDVYILRNTDKTQCIEFRYICSNIMSIKKYNLLKDESNNVINEILTHESGYKFSAIQSVKMLKFLESVC